MLNRVILIGRLTRDPELRYTPSGVAVTKFTLAVDRPFTNAQGNREADFIMIETWRKLAESCANYLAKGRLCAVEGRIQVDSFTKDGNRQYITKVNADNVRFLESKNQQDAEETGATRTQSQDPFQDDGSPVDVDPDDLPF